MIYYLQLKQNFDTNAMQAEVNRLAGDRWKEHYNKKHYEGNWTVLPLRAPGGDPQNILSVHVSAGSPMVYQDTPLLDECPYIKKVLDFFQCEKTAARLMKLEAGAVIKEHTDHEMNFEEGEARFHIPVFTNEKVDFYILDQRIPMREGECWYLNLSLKHRVTNAGSTGRIHLVIDCIVNDWVKKLFEEGAARKEEIDDNAGRAKLSPEDRKKTIEQLRLMNTAVSNELADKMESGEI